MKRSLFTITLGAFALAACSGGGNESGNASASVNDITGAGSTFVYPVLSAWSSDYANSQGKRINYQSIGSGGGIAQIRAGTVDFGASDKPLNPQDLAQGGANLAQFPIVIGGIVPVVHIDGVQPGQLHLTGQVLANIFRGAIHSWNDPAIAAINPGVHLPAASISVIHRSDGSGTTFNFTHYLSQVSPDWHGGPGEGTSVQWPSGVGGKGNEGVANYVRQLPNSIGYVEYAYVMQNHMTYAIVQNAAGQYVAPSAASFQAAAGSADWTHAQDFNLVMTNAPDAQAWPITATTFILMRRQSQHPDRTQAALGFFRWALEHGQPQAQRLDYVPLPPALVQQVEQYIQANLH